MKLIGERIRTAREGLGLSQSQLAKAVGISQESVRKWENGEIKSPRADTLLRLARKLRKDPEWIVNGASRGREGSDELDLLVTHFQRLDRKAQKAILDLVKSWPSAS